MHKLLIALPQSLTSVKPRWFWPIVASGTILALGLIGYSVHAYHAQMSQPTLVPLAQVTIPAPASATPTPAPTPTPAVAFSHLNGMAVTAGSEAERPLAVMIENHPDARPQSGLGEAAAVYEAIAEGGITRFMALYDDPNQVMKVGPIRSSRPYFIHFAAEYGAAYAHVGGSADAMSILASGTSGVKNIDGLTLGSPIFQRDLSRNVAIEHTMYSTTGRFWNYCTTQGWATSNNYPSIPFTDDAPLTARPSAEVVKVSVSQPSYAVEWDYDRDTNSYNRRMAGVPHIDAVTGNQITAKTVVLQQVSSNPYTESYEGGTINKTVSDVTVTGSGSAVVIENGTATKATWKYDGQRTRYYNATGTEIPLVRGLLWTELTYSDSLLSF